MKTPWNTTTRWAGRATAVTSAMALAVVLAACGEDASDASRAEDAGGTEPELLSQADWDKVVEAANEEGELTVFSSSGNSDKHFLEFEKVYPEIDITIERQPTSDLITRLEQELSVSKPAADVAYHAQAAWFTEKGEKKDLAPLKLSPEVAEGYADVEELTRYYGPVMRQPFVLVYNTESAAPVKTVDELLEKADGKKLGGLDAASSPTAAHQWMTYGEESEGFFERLGKLDLTVEASSVPLSQSVASGALDYAFPVPPGTIQPLVDEGAPVDQVVLDGATGIQYGAGVLSAAQHPNAAAVFVNWLMSQDGQEFMMDKFAPGAVVSGVGDSMAWDEVTSFETSGRTQDDVDAFYEGVWSDIAG